MRNTIRFIVAMLPCMCILVFSITLMLFGHRNSPPRQDSFPEVCLEYNSFKFSKCNNTVAFYLARDRSYALGVSMPALLLKAELTNETPDLRCKIPIIVVMKCGTILYCANADSLEADCYLLGRVDEIEIKALQNLTWDSFGISDNDAYVFDVAIDASFYVLELQHQGHFMSFKTWEGYKNQDPESRRVAINGLDTKAGIPVYLPEFYDKWKTVKEEILNLGKSIVDKEDTISVDVTFENDLLTVYNKEGDTLLELDFSPVETGTKTSDE